MTSTTLRVPRGLPLLGHIPWLIRDPLKFFTLLGRAHPDIAEFSVGLRKAVLTNNPTIIDRVVRDPSFERSAHTRFGMESFLGQGLFSLEGASHMRHRRLMQPAFSRQRLAQYAQVMAAETRTSIRAWSDGETRDMRDEMMRLTFAIVSSALFSADTRAEAKVVGDAIHGFLPWLTKVFRISLALPAGVPLPHLPSTRAAVARLHAVVGKIIAERRGTGDVDRGDLLSMMLSAGDAESASFRDDELVAEAVTMLFAGHETTAHAMVWTLHLLTRHPDVQERVAEELRRVAGTAELGPEHLPELVYTEQVIRETLRLYPPAWWADRVAPVDVELGGRRVAAGTMIVFSTYVTQRDPRWFAAGDSFDPEQFSAARLKQIPSGAYLPFGWGIHMCIGSAFAMMEAKLILGFILQRFRVTDPKGHSPRPLPLVTLGMADPLPLQLHRRQHQAVTEARCSTASETSLTNDA